MSRNNGINLGKHMVHLNSDILCACYVRTSGPKAYHNDLIEICFVPLNSEIQPAKIEGIYPFYAQLQLKRPENIIERYMKRAHITIAETEIKGIDPWMAADLFEQWVGKFMLPYRKKIVVLTHNWPRWQPFVKDWLGHLNYNFLISNYYRDILALSLFMNDCADYLNEQYPFPKNTLDYLGSQLKIEREKGQDTMAECITIAKIYKKMMTVYNPFSVGEVTHERGYIPITEEEEEYEDE
jgi:DNA polymerase III epsilon subunit-like protein